MVDLITKATPYVYLRGPKSIGERGAQRTAEQIPMHCPLQIILGARGRSEPQWITSNAVKAFGAETFDRNGPYWNHSNFMAENWAGNGNMFLAIRAKPANARTAMLRLSLEVIVADIPVYDRSDDGSIIVENGTPVVVETIIGTRLITHTGVSMYQPDNREFGKGNIIENYRDGASVINGRPLGEVTLPDGTKVTTRSKLYPIHDLEVDSFGRYGNNVGISYGTPTTVDAQPTNAVAVENNKAFYYRLACWERPNANSTPVLQPGMSGENANDLTFKEGTVYPANKKASSISKCFIKAYQLINDPQFPNEYGPFGRSHVYATNISQVLNMVTGGFIYTGPTGDIQVVGEKAYDVTAEEYGRTEGLSFADPKNAALFNFITGYDINNVPYFAVDARSSHLYGGVSLANNAVVYATGGSDGLWYSADGSPADLVNLRQLDLAARQIFSNPDQMYQLGNMFRYPISAIWDSGWSMNTKLAMIDMLGLRPDIAVYTGTQSVIDDFVSIPGREVEPLYLDGDTTNIPTDSTELLGGWNWCEINDDTTELARGNQLRSRYNLFPSSAYHSTATLYGAIFGHGEYFINEDAYDGILPFTFDRANQYSLFCGGPAWVEGQRPTTWPNNVVSMFATAKNTYRKLPQLNKFWDAGINYVQFADTKGLFWPAQQTVYPNDTSPLNGINTMMAVLFGQRAWCNVWKYLTGRDDLDDEQMIQESDRLMLAELEGRFGDGVSYTVESEILEADREAGYIWRGRLNLFTNTPKTVAIFDIYSHRRSDLETAGVV